MHIRCLVATLSVLAITVLVPASAAGQSRKWTPPRTPDGKPDIEGTFTQYDLAATAARGPRRQGAPDARGGGRVCHEGNYGLRGVLSGARFTEKAGTAK